MGAGTPPPAARAAPHAAAARQRAAGPALRPDAEFGGPFGPAASTGERVFVAQHSRVLELETLAGREQRVARSSKPLGQRIQALAAAGELVVAASGNLSVLRPERGGLVLVGELALRAPAHLAAIVGDEVWLADGAPRVLRVSLADPSRPRAQPGWALPPPAADAGTPTILDMQAAAVSDAPVDSPATRVLLLVEWQPSRPRPPRLELMEVDSTTPAPRVVARTDVPGLLGSPKMAVEGTTVVVAGRGVVHSLVERGRQGLSAPTVPRAGMPFGSGETSDLLLVDGTLWVAWLGTLSRWGPDGFSTTVAATEVHTVLRHESRLLTSGDDAVHWFEDLSERLPRSIRGPRVEGDYKVLRSAQGGAWMRNAGGNGDTFHWMQLGRAPGPLTMIDAGPIGLSNPRDVVESAGGRLFGLTDRHVLALDASDRPEARVQERLAHDGEHRVPPSLVAATDDAVLWRDGHGQLRLWWPTTAQQPSVERSVAGGANAEQATFDGGLLWLRLIPSGLQSAFVGDRTTEPAAIVPLPGMTAPHAPVRGGIAWVGIGADVSAVDLRRPSTPRELQLIDLPGTVRDIALGTDLLWVHWDNGVNAGLQVFDLHREGRATQRAAVPLAPSLRLFARSPVPPALAADGRDAWLLVDGAVQHYRLDAAPTPTVGPTRRPPAASPTPERTRIPAATTTPASQVVLPWLQRGQ
jgi:hypothetical protein